ncbi:MAG: type II toxin-antitoxin system VapC family toxin [Bdellovibrionaceae bacterium]|nr:type II toxin-antitoxin system VapC family toxin [Pseudobdellovibrionaceae bacterium]
MRLLIDSNRFIDFCAGDEEVIRVMESAALLCIPYIVLAEIRAGSLVTKRGQSQVRVLLELLNQPGVRSVHSTDATTHHYATLYGQLRKAGTPIPTNDIWIAALAIEHDLILYSREAHFEKIPTLARLG